MSNSIGSPFRMRYQTGTRNIFRRKISSTKHIHLIRTVPRTPRLMRLAGIEEIPSCHSISVRRAASKSRQMAQTCPQSQAPLAVFVLLHSSGTIQKEPFRVHHTVSYAPECVLVPLGCCGTGITYRLFTDRRRFDCGRLPDPGLWISCRSTLPPISVMIIVQRIPRATGGP